MMVFCHLRGVAFLVEQPLNSFLYWVPGIKDAISTTGAVRFVTNLGAFGAESMKPVEIWGTIGPAIVKILTRNKAAATTRLGPNAQTLASVKPVKTKKIKTTKTNKTTKKSKCAKPWAKNGWWSGNKKIQKQSEHYPHEFSELLADQILSRLSVAANQATRLDQ